MSSHPQSDAAEGLLPQYLLLFLMGGLLTGVGALNLYWSFGYSEGALNSNLHSVGFSGIDNIALLTPSADYSIPPLVLGILCMIIANANAYKTTNGY